MAAKSKSNKIEITRIYDAPVAMVWDAWVDPAQVAQWWGPRGFTLTTEQKDVRPGGTWTYMMHGPDGTNYPNKTLFHEVDKHKRLVYDHGANDDRPPMFRVTVLFTELAGKKTQMEMTMALRTAEEAEQTRKFIKQAGGDSTWDRLAEFLAPTDQFYINRSFEVPIQTMFDAWSDPAQLSQWLPPTGFTMEYVRPAAIRAGGEGFYRMSNGQGVTMYGKVRYLEVTRPSRLVYTQIFCDEHEKISRHPMAPTWPETMWTAVTFTEEGPDQTRVTVQWQVHGEATDVERETFKQAKPGMTQGWTGSFEKLENHLENQLRKSK
jgi:uncharacterized protein YndB with AHSA1/START domain